MPITNSPIDRQDYHKDQKYPSITSGMFLQGFIFHIKKIKYFIAYFDFIR